MRLASYNILDGGEGRADPLAEVLIAQRADVTGVVEADNPAVLERLSTRLGMDYAVGQGESHVAAVFSRWAIGDTINHAALRRDGPRCLLEAEVTSPGGDTWVFGVIHLSPRAFEADERKREAEVDVLLEVFAPHRAAGRPHVLMGDFNANSPFQLIDPAECKKKTREAWEANGGQIPRRAIQKLLDAGYLDTLRVARPADAENLGSFTTLEPGQRLDYIYAWGVEPSRIADAWIERDRLAQFASDHYPVGAEIVAG